MTELHLTSYLITISVQVWSFMFKESTMCAAPKRRFRPYMPDVSKNVNDKDVRKARKAELQRDEAVGKALPIAIAVGVLALAALYFYVNNTT
uniref:Uncharacterized protein n=1 Tax=Arabidopsis halleri TaxID=81970 RepID=K4FZN1_ARAHA|nr:hypothetical protein 11M19.6 [Arabidopsis halleri]